jgi:outer membrane protein TolC
MKRLKITTFLLITLTAQPSFSSGITLQQAVEYAYQNNEEIKAQEFSLAASGSLKTRAVVGGFLPQVAIDINQGDKKFKIGDNATVNGSVDTRDFSVSQDLFNGGKSVFDIKRANAVEQKERFSLLSKKQDIALQVVKSYADILKYHDLFELGNENIESYKNILDHTRKKLQARDTGKADLAKAEADYISAVNDQANVNNNLLSAQANFIKLTGFRADEIRELAVFSKAKIDQKFVNLNQIQTEELALKNNPDLKAAEQNQRAAKFESFIAKSNLSPTATFKYQVSEDKKSLFFNNQRQRNDSFFVNFHIPLFSSGT